MKRLVVISLFVCTLPALGAGAETGTPARGITLEAALQKALHTNLTLQKNAIDNQTALRAKNNQWSEIFPGLSANASFSYGPFGIARPAPRDAEGSWSASAGISLQLHAGLPATLRLITLAWQSSLLSYETSKIQLEITVSKAFYQLLADEHNLAILRDRQTQAERESAQAHVSFTNGLMSELNYRRALLSVEQAKIELRRVESAYRQDLAAFFINLGMEDEIARDGGENFSLDGSITITRQTYDAAALIERYLPQRPDIAAARHAVERAELSRSALLMQNTAPQIGLSGRYSGGASGGGYEDTLNFSVSVNIPLESWIPGTKPHQSLQKAGDDIRKTQLDLENTQTQARQTIRSLCETLNNSWDNIEIARLSVQLATLAYEMSARGFREGAVDFLAMEASRGSLASARQNLLVEELRYKLAGLDLAQALNIAVATFESGRFIHTEGETQ